MKKTIFTIVAVAVLVLTLLPVAALADGPKDPELEVEDVNVALAAQLAKADQDAWQWQWGKNWSDQTEIAKLFNLTKQDAEVKAENEAKVFGASAAFNVAKSGWVVSIGNITAVKLNNTQYADASAYGHVMVVNKAGDSEAWSLAKDAEAKGGGAEAESGDSDNDAFSKNVGVAASVPTLSGNAVAANVDPCCKKHGDDDKNDGKDDKECCPDEAKATGGDSEAESSIWSHTSADGYNPATNNGDGGDAWAQNWSQANAQRGGDAVINDSAIGNFGGMAANAATFNISGWGNSGAKSGDAWTGNATSTVSSCLSQTANPGLTQQQTASPYIDQDQSNPQTVEQDQWQVPVNAVLQLLAQVQDSFKK